MTSENQTSRPMASSRIHVETKYIPPSEVGLPALAVQTTRLVDTYMMWVGTTSLDSEEVQNAPTQGALAKDWACAMPPRELSGSAAAATSLFRSSGSDAALSISQRLARRFKKQVFLSIDIPPSLGAMGQEGRLLLAIERAVVGILKSDEERLVEADTPGDPRLHDPDV